LSQDWPGGQDGSVQQVSSTQLPDTQSTGSSQPPPFGTLVSVAVAVGALVAVGVLAGVCGRQSTPHVPPDTHWPAHWAWKTPLLQVWLST